MRPSSQVDLRLVVDAQLPSRECAAQLAFERQSRRELVVHLVGEELVAVLAATFDVVHRDVGALNQRLDGITRLRIHRDADARADEQLMSVDDERRRELVEHFACDHDDVVARSHFGQQQRELVAAESRQRVAAAQTSLQSIGYRFQQPVAHRMTERVVDDLESIEIEEHHREATLVPLRLSDREAEAILQQRAVRQVRQQVVIGLKVDDLLCFFALGNVARSAVRADEVLSGALVGSE